MTVDTGAGFDAVLVGAGHNSLVAAAVLARAGWKVCVLERSDCLGGSIRTAPFRDAPEYQHEVFAGFHPQFTASEAYAALGEELTARGVEYANTDLPTATILPDGSSIHLSTSVEGNIEEFERHGVGDGAAWADTTARFFGDAELTFALLRTELWSRAGGRWLARLLRTKRGRGALEFVAELTVPARQWLTESFCSEAARGLLAPWPLHVGLGPDDPASAFFARALSVLQQAHGAPVPRGGGSRLVNALAAMVRDHGGVLETQSDVTRVLVDHDRAKGVELSDGSRITARRAVLCSVTPTQLYSRLLEGVPLPDDYHARAARFRYEPSALQVNLALSAPPRWAGDERLARTAFVNVTPGLDAVSREINEARRGLLPANPTLGVGQPMHQDPSRGPAGGWVFWIQLLTMPARPRGDAAGQIDCDGAWTAALRERYADRVVDRLSEHVVNLAGALVDRVVYSPVDLEAMNVNLVDGHHNGGSYSLDQFALGRPFPGRPSHRTPIDRLWHIGASTQPGPGLNAGSGWAVGQALLRRRPRTVR